VLLYIYSLCYTFKQYHGFLFMDNNTPEGRFLFVTALTSKSPMKIQSQKTIRQRLWEKRYIYLMVIPGMAFFLLFRYAPMYGIQLAFKEFSIADGITNSPWVGLLNFRQLLIEREFWLAFQNTLIISYMQLILFFPFPIILSIVINEIKPRKYKRTVQTIYTFPHFLSWVIVAGIMLNMLSSNGMFNNLLNLLGYEPHSFLTDKSIFRYLLIASLSWKEAGWSCILYLAALTSIDPSLYEAATIDGANRWHRIRYISWPGMQVIVITTLILRIGHMMDAGFDQIMNLYNPTVFDVADILDTYIYRITFQRPANFGFSTAVGLFKGVTNCILLVSVNAICKRFSGTGIIG